MISSREDGHLIVACELWRENREIYDAVSSKDIAVAGRPSEYYLVGLGYHLDHRPDPPFLALKTGGAVKRRNRDKVLNKG